ncbi:hypothetical protein NE865_04468 [Phthorimaea operculella]|nr:hypothetical protein NE865_04468 [Phthorimaea operculella]
MMMHFMNSQRAELKNISDTLGDIKQTNTDIQNSIAFLTEQNQVTNTRISSIEDDVKDNRDLIILLEDKIEKQEMNIRKANIELKNVPCLPNENKEELVSMILSLSKNIGCEMSPYYIKDIYRIAIRKKDESKKEKTNAPIIVEFSSVIKKTEIMFKAKQFNKANHSKLRAKDLGFKVQEETPIYISENLTQKSSRLYFLARDL